MNDVHLAAPSIRAQFVRFALVGAAGFVVDESVLALMHGVLGLDPFVARAISILTAMTFTWWGNRALTFRTHAARGPAAVLREWLRFVGANALGKSNFLDIFRFLHDIVSIGGGFREAVEKREFMKHGADSAGRPGVRGGEIGLFLRTGVFFLDRPGVMCYIHQVHSAGWSNGSSLGS